MSPLLAALLLLPILILIIKKSRTILTSRNHQQLLPPCPPRIPILGNLHQLSSLPHQSLAALSRKHGPLMLLYLGQAPTLIVSSADAAKEIMKTYDHIFASRPPVKAANIFFNGGKDIAFSPYGEHWRQMRKLCVNHLLSTRMVQSFRILREEEVASMVSRISHEMSLSPSVINMSEILSSFMSKLMCRALFGRYFFREEECFKRICKLVEELAVIIGQLSIADYIPSLGWLDKLSGFERRATRISKKWDAFLEEIIKDHERKRWEAKDENDAARDIAEEKDFIDILLPLQKDDAEFSLDRVAIKAILMDMIGAGMDTSFVVLDWGMTELVRNPETMKKLQDEVRGIADAGSSVKEKDLSEMSYLKAVIKETLRLHPPVPLLVPRESTDRCRIQGYDIEKNTRVIVNDWAIGRDPRYWQEPEKFWPERFLSSDVDWKGNDFEFIPFGSGRRICPGMQFASCTLELAFANLVNKFDWELPGGMKCEDLNMAESPGMATQRRQRLCLVPKPLIYSLKHY